MEMQWSIVDGACIIDSVDLGPNNYMGHNRTVSRSIQELVYVFDSMDEINSRILASSEVGEHSRAVSRTNGELVFIFDSTNLGHDHSNMENNDGTLRVIPVNQEDSIKNLERVTIEEKQQSPNSMCSICLGTLSVGSEAVRIPDPCSHVFHQRCITKWFNISNTCPLCRRTI